MLNYMLSFWKEKDWRINDKEIWEREFGPLRISLKFEKKKSDVITHQIPFTTTPVPIKEKAFGCHVASKASQHVVIFFTEPEGQQIV